MSVCVCVCVYVCVCVCVCLSVCLSVGSQSLPGPQLHQQSGEEACVVQPVCVSWRGVINANRIRKKLHMGQPFVALLSV